MAESEPAREPVQSELSIQPVVECPILAESEPGEIRSRPESELEGRLQFNMHHTTRCHKMPQLPTSKNCTTSEFRMSMRRGNPSHPPGRIKEAGSKDGKALALERRAEHGCRTRSPASLLECGNDPTSSTQYLLHVLYHRSSASI